MQNATFLFKSDYGANTTANCFSESIDNNGSENQQKVNLCVLETEEKSRV